MIRRDDDPRPLYPAAIAQHHGLRHRRAQRRGVAGAVAAAGRPDRQSRPVGRGVPLSGAADPAALSRHRPADRRLYRGAVRLQPADLGERAGRDARRGNGPVGAGPAGLCPGRDRLRRAAQPVGLFPAGLEPRVQGSAVRDPQPLRLGAAAGGHVHDDFEQADDLYRRARRARRGHRPADQRQSRSAAAGHDHGRARRLRR